MEEETNDIARSVPEQKGKEGDFVELEEKDVGSEEEEEEEGRRREDFLSLVSTLQKVLKTSLPSEYPRVEEEGEQTFVPFEKVANFRDLGR